jgi:hypothetical protein
LVTQKKKKNEKILFSMDTKAEDFFRGRGDFDEVGVEESVVTAGVLWMEDIYIYGEGVGRFNKSNAAF